MRIIVAAKGNQLTSPVDEKFGHAAYFITLDSESGQILDAFDNRDHSGEIETGKETAERVASLAGEALVSLNMGPKALKILKEAGVRVLLLPDGAEQATVGETVEYLRRDELSEA